MFGSALFLLILLSEIAGVRFGRASFSEIRSLLCQAYSLCARKIAYEHRAATADNDLQQNLRVSLEESESAVGTGGDETASAYFQRK